MDIFRGRGGGAASHKPADYCFTLSALVTWFTWTTWLWFAVSTWSTWVQNPPGSRLIILMSSLQKSSWFSIPSKLAFDISAAGCVCASICENLLQMISQSLQHLASKCQSFLAKAAHLKHYTNSFHRMFRKNITNVIFITINFESPPVPEILYSSSLSRSSIL